MKSKQTVPIFILTLSGFIILYGCRFEKPKKESPASVVKEEVKIPEFNADSAYSFVNSQVEFGPRVPNTPAHLACGDYLKNKLDSYQFAVFEQEFQDESFDGKMLNLRNLIGSIYPEKSKRILLSAHWDTRPFADKDSIRKFQPIDGANDGASGVGVLLEIARVMASFPTKQAGVDIIFFDGEDYGEPADYKYNIRNDRSKIWWCLGSQYWSENKYPNNYIAYFGILLDMVGAANAHFYKEGTSIQFAPKIVNKVWAAASETGYGNFFIDQPSPGITDDHVFINRAGIPTIDIVEFKPGDHDSYFAEYHHTHQDNMQIIDKQTLRAVGQTLLTVIYNE